MTKNLIITALALFLANISFAQGLNWNQEEFENTDRLMYTRTELPRYSSMSKYAPYTFLQHGSTCVAYSLASARTILWAKDNNVMDQAEITRNAFSPWFVYYRNKDLTDMDCSLGLEPVTAIEDVLNNGIAPLWDVEFADYWPFTESVLTSWYPPDYSLDLVTAQNYRLDAAYRLETLGDIKYAIHEQMVVLVGMYPPANFGDLVGVSDWDPLETEQPDPEMGHAMILLGYDDDRNGGSVQILNSWSDQWGDGGYIWVNYDDFLRFTAGAYGLETNPDAKFSAGSEIFADTDKSSTITVDGEPAWSSTSDFELKGDPAEVTKQFGGLNK